MAMPRPKILTAVTVPTAGWLFVCYVSKAGTYDEKCEVTIPAGTYFVSGDNQSDDLLYVLQGLMATELAAEMGAPGEYYMFIDITPTTHKIRLGFWGFVPGAAYLNDIKVAFSECSAGLCTALGFAATDVTSTAVDNPVFTANYHHGYGWYADEDGQLERHDVVDTPLVYVVHGTAPFTGRTKTVYYGERYGNILQLQFLERDTDGRTKVWSNGTSYGTVPPHPYNPNEPLECWWREARQGIRFRVYEYGRLSTGDRVEYGTATADNTTTLTDSTKAWDTVPQRWANRLIYHPSFITCSEALGQTLHIASNTATVLTVTNAHPNGIDTVGAQPAGAVTYNLLDMTYRTYVVDLERMKSFAPTEIPSIDRWDIAIPLKRYVA